jgi:hypothetical protein
MNLAELPRLSVMANAHDGTISDGTISDRILRIGSLIMRLPSKAHRAGNRPQQQHTAPVRSHHVVGRIPPPLANGTAGIAHRQR